MSGYGASDNLPYQEGDLVNNPRYQGQSAGTVPHGPTGPQQESRYGAAPLSTGQGGGVMDKLKAAVGLGAPNPNVNHPNEERGFGGGLGHQGVDEYGNPRHNTGVDQYGNPRQEGVVDKLKDAAGVGPNSGYNQGHNQGLDQYGNPRHHNTGVDQYGNPRHNTGYDEYGNPRREGVVDKVKDAAGVGPNSYNQGLDQYGNPRHNTGVDEYGNPRREGVVDKLKDAAGVGPNSYNQGHNQGLDQYGNPRHNTGVDEYGNPRHHNTGVDEYGNPRREGVVDKLKDAVGVGPNSGGYDPAFPNAPQDRIHGVPESGERIPGRIPLYTKGETRVEPGYMSKGVHLPGHNDSHHTTGGTGLGGTGLGGHGVDDRRDDEFRGTGLSGHSRPFDNRTGNEYGEGIGTGRHHDNYDDTNTGTGLGGPGIEHTGEPKKGLVAKIKEKLHHEK